jgi:hypothetical protein
LEEYLNNDSDKKRSSEFAADYFQTIPIVLIMLIYEIRRKRKNF